MNTTSLDHWLQWRERCDIRRCDSECQSSLRRFVVPRFRRYVNQEAASSRMRLQRGIVPEISEEESWHEFEVAYILDEVFLQNHQLRLAAKDHLLAKGLMGASPGTLDRIEATATNRILDIARRWLLERYSRSEIVSPLPAPDDQDPASDPLERVGARFPLDLSPALAEYREVAQDLIDRVLPAPKASQQWALALAYREIDLSSPEACACSGLGKSQLYHGLKSFRETLEAALASCHELDNANQKFLVRLLVERLLGQAWSENLKIPANPSRSAGKVA